MSTVANSLTLERPSAGDLPFIMATERTEGFEHFVGRWDEAQHRAAFSDQRCAYFVGRSQGRPAGFVILRDWDSPERVTSVKRIAVFEPGTGVGRVLLSLAVERVFSETAAHRLWLGVFPENTRARRAHEAVGFVEEGVARGSACFGGVYRDALIMSLLRPQWLSRRGG